LWAAVRFGPGGISLTLLTTTLVAVWAGARAHGPFAGMPPAESVLAFQIFLSVVGIPLLCLAAVIEERRRAQEALAERLRFEELLSRLSGSFVHLSVSGTDAAFATSLRELGLFLGVDRLVVYRLSRDSDEVLSAYSWIRPGAVVVPPLATIEGFPGCTPSSSPSARSPSRESRRPGARGARRGDDANARGALDARAAARGGGGVLGCLSFVMFTAERAWPDELIQRLRLVAEVFARALAQKDADEAIRASETLKSAILASLTSGVAVLDRAGAWWPSTRAGPGSRRSPRPGAARLAWVRATSRAAAAPASRVGGRRARRSS